MAPPIATLEIVQTSATCVRYQLVTAGRVVWQNRVVPCDAGHQGARERMAAWALKHGVTVETARRQTAELLAKDRR